MDRTSSLTVLPVNTSSGAIKVYNAKTETQWRLALIALAMGAFGLLPLKHILDWFFGGPQPGGRVFLTAAAAIFFIPLGILSITNALRGLPRLTITPDGFKFENGIRTRWTRWDSVGPFVVKTVSASQFKQTRVVSAVSHDSRARNVSIPDCFTAPIDAITSELNAVRTQATGDTKAFSDLDAEQTSIGLAQFRIPWLTFALLAVLIVIFTLENILATTPGGRGLTPSIATLLAFGASNHELILSNGEWYRLFAAPLLHGNLVHIMGNSIALVLGGWLLERLVGRLWLFSLFAVGALCGSLFSLAVNPINMVSVGASGALMALFAALLVGSFRYASGTTQRQMLQFSSLRILVPSLVPFFQTSTAGHIDYGAHIGGALSGAALAFLLLKHWPDGARIPQLRNAAASVSAIGALLFLVSGGLVIANFPRSTLALHLTPPALPSPPIDVMSNHGPKRVTCDAQWNALQQRDPGAYQAYLQNCMQGGPAASDDIAGAK